MSRTRAWRRWQYQKRKRNRKHYWGGPWKEDGVIYTKTEEERLGMLATTPHPCSCIGCSDLRRMEGPPMQERRATVNAQEQIEEARGELPQAA